MLATTNPATIVAGLTKRAVDTATGTLAKGGEIGHDLVEQLLDGIPGISPSSCFDIVAFFPFSG